MDKNPYLHNRRADKNPYRHDRRVDKNPYRHDSRADSQCRFFLLPNYLPVSMATVSKSLDKCS